MKCKCKIIDKLYNLTPSEWKLFYFLIRHSDEYDATVRGVYYKDVIEETGISRPVYYLALTGLEEKNIIKVTNRDSGLDCDVYIIDNEYPTLDYKVEPYINFNMPIFHSPIFMSLKANEKFLMLTFLRCTFDKGYSMQRNVKLFYEKYKKLLKVSIRVIRSYMHSLKQFFIIGIKEGMYYITRREKPKYHRENDSLGKSGIEVVPSKAEEMYFLEQMVRSECNRCHIAYTDNSLEDTAHLVATFRGRFKEQGAYVSTHIVLQRLIESIRMSVENIERKCRKLSAPYINIILDEELKKL